jgi:hypothetical protein
MLRYKEPCTQTVHQKTQPDQQFLLLKISSQAREPESVWAQQDPLTAQLSVNITTVSFFSNSSAISDKFLVVLLLMMQCP